MIHNSKFKHSGGFTIIELLVAMTVFVIVISIVAVTFISTLRAQRTLVTLMAANDNASLALEQMMREIRTGKTFCLGAVCPQQFEATPDTLSFTNAHAVPVVYRLNTGTHAIERSENNGVFAPITGAAVAIDRLTFELVGRTLTGPGVWPERILILFRSSTVGNNVAIFFTNWQTSVSVRTLQ